MGTWCGDGQGGQPGSWTLEGPPLTPPWVLNRETAEPQTLNAISSAPALASALTRFLVAHGGPGR